MNISPYDEQGCALQVWSYHPRLQDVEISETKARELYWDLSLIIRKMYHQCKLVHGDLSEFNLLYHEGKACVIDVSQSVEHDHPHALEFLRKDIHNVNEFFRKKKVRVKYFPSFRIGIFLLYFQSSVKGTGSLGRGQDFYFVWSKSQSFKL